jgi:putative lipoic acid-binding regulatory protein
MEPKPDEGIVPESCGAPFGGAQMSFPVTFDLRIIYVLSEGASIQKDLEAIYARLGVEYSLLQGISKPGAKYGRFGSRITVRNRAQFYAVYSEVGKLPYVKAAI